MDRPVPARSTSQGLIVRRAGLGHRRADIRIAGDRIVEIGTVLERRAGEEELDACGGEVLPGLHDHHLHLRAAAAAQRSMQTGPPQVKDRPMFEAALHSTAGTTGWLRGVGYHDSVAGPLDRWLLDGIVPDRPVRIQHRSGSLWILNSAAIDLLGVPSDPSPGVERDPDGRPTGRLWRMDAWVAERLAAQAGPRVGGDDDLAAFSASSLRRGVTGWTDATPGRTMAEAWSLARAVESGLIRQRLHLMLPAEADPSAVAELGQIPGVSIGAVKILLDDTELPTLDELADQIARAHATGRPVAVHCVTPVQVVLTSAALEGAGPHRGDRIEHGALIPRGLLPRLAALQIVVVTQPNFVFERGDTYLAEVPPGEHDDLWRAASLVEAGVGLAAGTDAPFGTADPWVAVRSATRRLTASGRPLAPTEAVGPHDAARLWAGPPADPGRPRQLRPGQPADLVVLGAPLQAALTGDGEVPVAATVIGGMIATQPP
jgi:predicted amidohydrolase YtcJ